MMTVLPGDVYKSSQSIIFNPVSVKDVGAHGFLERVKVLYPLAYKSYQEKLLRSTEEELLGDIQLVYIGKEQFILNGYCVDKEGKLSELALCKTLIELCNLAHEYSISVGIEYALGYQDEKNVKDIDLIIKAVFEDMNDMDVKIYNRSTEYFE